GRCGRKAGCDGPRSSETANRSGRASRSGSGLGKGPAAAPSRNLHAGQGRGLEDLLAQDLGRLVLPFAALIRARVRIPLVTLFHVPSSSTAPAEWSPRRSGAHVR